MLMVLMPSASLSVNFSISSQPYRLFDELRERQSNTTVSTSRQREFAVQPHEFGLLRTGGEENDFIVEAFIYRTARAWKATGKPYLLVTFQ